MSRPLEEIQDELISQLHAGEPIDREAVLAAHPEHREQLARFLDLMTHLESPPAVEDLRPATLGEFRILRELGRGGMGIVYEAEQKSLKRRVALKVLPGDLLGSPRIVARFRREAEAAGRLRHPGIVPVYSVGEARGAPFFSMELVEGRSLAEVLKARSDGQDAGLPPAGPLWQRWVVALIAKVADALHYAHGQDILHRDVKPANVLLEADGTPRLTDFGLALDLGAPGLTSPGESCGTPLYMSPEQALRREVPLDPRTDVYSLGVTLYEALTLHTPYRGLSAAEVFAALRQGTIVTPREVDPSLPEAWERVILKALARETADRYASAAALAADLRALLDGRAAEAPMPAAPASKPGRSRRSLRLVAALGAVALVAAVAAIFALRGRDEREGVVPAAERAQASRASKGETPWKLLRPEGAPEGVLVSQAQLAEAQRLSVPVWFENSIGMRFVLVPAGRFTMGVPEGEPGRGPDDPLPHEVALANAYYVGVTEVTNGHIRRWNPLWHASPQDDVALDADEEPAAWIHLRDARTFATFLSGKESRTYRVPTEQEWEYAARAGTSGRTFWGEDPADVARFANVLDEDTLAHWPKWSGVPVGRDGFLAVAPVGSFLPNPWGLYDMLGNVFELCALAPGATRSVHRGSGWSSAALNSRSGGRGFGENDTHCVSDGGVRLVCDLKAPTKSETPWKLLRPEGAPEGVLVSQAQLAEAQRLSVPVWFENSIGMRFVLIPAGTFTMGSPPHEPGHEYGEVQHEVTLTRPYYLQTTELTWKQWRAWDPSATTSPLDGQPVAEHQQPLMRVEPTKFDGFIAWLHAREAGRTYRLPTEAEWEHACRAGTTTAWYWGEDPTQAVRHGNTADDSLRLSYPELATPDGDGGFQVTAPVGSFLPNPWGLFDMVGNVGEWTLDTFAPFGPGPQVDPLVRGFPGRVSRGAAWWNPSLAQRSAQRSWPKYDVWQDIGVRLLLEVPGLPAVPRPAPVLAEAQLAEAKRLGVPAWFENPLGMRFVLIPAGKFIMGSRAREPGRNPDEVQHEVTLSRAFYLQTTETTWAQWRRWDSAGGGTLFDGEPTDADDQPVTAVNAEGSLVGYINWLRAQDEGRGYRLPTEAEWEYACRAGATARWFWGDDARDAARFANVAGRLALSKHPDWRTFPIEGYAALPLPVGSFFPSPWGLHDLIGNVAEWVQDGYGALGTEARVDPVSAQAAPDRIIRGGTWHNPPALTRSATRAHVPWGGTTLFHDIGFRLVCELPASAAPSGEAPAPRDQATPWPLETPKDGPAWARVSRRQIEEAERLKVPVAFENGVGLRFVLIPAGEFLMGSPETEPGHQPHETQHRVTLTKPCYLQTTELTAGQWRAWDSTLRTSEHFGKAYNDDAHPATTIDYRRIAGFLAWLGTQDPGHAYRLPTEAEWEHACRAGTTTVWFWGDDARQAARYANVADRSFLTVHPTAVIFDVDDGHVGPAHVGSYAPNPWGLHDMLGNVVEWCADAHAPFGAGPVTDPLVQVEGQPRVVRSGAFSVHPHALRSAWRGPSTPGIDTFSDTTIRVACDVPAR